MRVLERARRNDGRGSAQVKELFGPEVTVKYHSGGFERDLRRYAIMGIQTYVSLQSEYEAA